MPRQYLYRQTMPKADQPKATPEKHGSGNEKSPDIESDDDASEKRGKGGAKTVAKQPGAAHAKSNDKAKTGDDSSNASSETQPEVALEGCRVALYVGRWKMSITLF